MSFMHDLLRRPGRHGVDRPNRRPRAIATGLVLGWAGVGAIGALGPALPALAEDALPPAETVIQKMIDACGGADAYAGLQTRFTRGVMHLTWANLEMTRSVWAQRPNQHYVLIESPKLGQIVGGSDGTTVWEQGPKDDPSIKRGRERALVLWESDIGSWSNWKTYYDSATTAGVDTVDGHAAWKVDLVTKEGAKHAIWVDQTSNLLLKHSLWRLVQTGEVPNEIFYDDYREVCGVKMPFRSRGVISMMGGDKEVVFTMDSVACNPTIPQDRFDLPAEVKAFLEKLPAQAAPAGNEPGK